MLGVSAVTSSNVEQRAVISRYRAENNGIENLLNQFDTTVISRLFTKKAGLTSKVSGSFLLQWEAKAGASYPQVLSIQFLVRRQLDGVFIPTLGSMTWAFATTLRGPEDQGDQIIPYIMEDTDTSGGQYTYTVRAQVSTQHCDILRVRNRNLVLEQFERTGT